MKPKSGPPGTAVMVKGWSFGAYETVGVFLIDSGSGVTKLGHARTDGAGAFAVRVAIPADATPGPQTVKTAARGSAQIAKRTFTVT